MIHRVVLSTNAAVMVMDEAGRPLPDYAGRLDQVGNKILRDAPASTDFQMLHRDASGKQQLVRVGVDNFLEALRLAARVTEWPIGAESGVDDFSEALRVAAAEAEGTAGRVEDEPPGMVGLR